MLTKRLEARVWEGMLDPESPLYEPTLLGMLQNTKNKKKAPTNLFVKFTVENGIFYRLQVF